MTRTRRGAAGDGSRDAGAILVLTLILCVVLGIVATGLATYASAGLRTSKVTDYRSQRLASVDAGLRIGMELVKADPSSCLDRDVAYTGANQINGANVTVRCTVIQTTTAWVQYRITATIALQGSASGTAVVQASTSSGLPCLAVPQVPSCQLTINAWAVSG